jgi:hypothetical protein
VWAANLLEPPLSKGAKVCVCQSIVDSGACSHGEGASVTVGKQTDFSLFFLPGCGIEFQLSNLCLDHLRILVRVCSFLLLPLLARIGGGWGIMVMMGMVMAIGIGCVLVPCVCRWSRACGRRRVDGGRHDASKWCPLRFAQLCGTCTMIIINE